MKITAIGTGAAFSNKNYNQCFMLDDKDFDDALVHGGSEKRMLVDCGFQTGAALYKAGIKLNSITDVYISHAHADHIGFLEGLGFQRYDWMKKPATSKEDCEHVCPGAKRSRLDSSYYAPNLIANSKLMKDLWDHSLRGGLQSIEGLDATLETFFYTIPIESNQPFTWGKWTCRLIQQIHIMTGSMISNTFGLFMERKTDGFKVYFTTDSQHCSPRQMEIFYKQADLIFQDCECIGVDTVTRQSKFMSGVHANYAQLAGWESANSAKLSKEIKAKMLLTHYQDCVTDKKDCFGNDCDWDQLANDDGFKGFVKVGQEFSI